VHQVNTERGCHIYNFHTKCMGEISSGKHLHMLYIRTATLFPLSGLSVCEVFKMVAVRTTVFQDATLCSLEGRYHTYWTESGIQLPNYMVSHSRGSRSLGSMTSTLNDETEEVSKMMVSAQL
jgi:hypothetical protein